MSKRMGSDLKRVYPLKSNVILKTVFPLIFNPNFDHFLANDLENRVKELLLMRSSVRNELRQLESKRRDILQEISEYTNKLEVLKSQLMKKSSELDRIQVSLEQTKYAQKEVLLKSNALLAPPLQLLPSLPQTNGKTYEEQFERTQHFCGISRSEPKEWHKIVGREERQDGLQVVSNA